MRNVTNNKCSETLTKIYNVNIMVTCNQITHKKLYVKKCHALKILSIEIKNTTVIFYHLLNQNLK